MDSKYANSQKKSHRTLQRQWPEMFKPLCIKSQVKDSAWLVSDDIFAENRHKGHIEIQLLTLLRIGAVSEGK